MKRLLLIPALLAAACGGAAPEPCTPAALETVTTACEAAIAERPEDEAVLGPACERAISSWYTRCGGGK